ncbi:hypothetical protein HID58_086720 [Brassica napus]|uniref:Ion transport domain-containing protein n=1 Tax=Brassica napus TaxID=3708 RepID=A0ABQ7XRE1_BRANA|nr:hypothetical protein HID58_086720 [Brassica napus]
MKSLKLENTHNVVISKCIQSDTSWFRFESIILPRAARRASSHAQLVDLVETDVYAQGLLDKLSNSQEDETDQGECNKQKMSALDVKHKMRRMLISLKRFGCGEEIIKASAMMFVKVNANNISMLVANESWQKTNESRQETNFSKNWCIENDVTVFYGYIILSILLFINVVIGSFLEWKMQKNILQKLERLWRNFILVSSKQSDIASIKRCITEGVTSFHRS